MVDDYEFTHKMQGLEYSLDKQTYQLELQNKLKVVELRLFIEDKKLSDSKWAITLNDIDHSLDWSTTKGD